MTTQEDFYRDLTAEINRQIEPVYGVRVTLIRSESQGDFHWFYENLDGIFNQGTFDYVSARVSPDDTPWLAQISPAGGFPNAYIQVVTGIYYQLSPADAARLQKAVADAAVQATVVVQTYQNIFGTITTAQMAEGQAALGTTAVSNKQDYVIGFAMGYQWSGRREQNQPALAYTEMEKAPDLRSLLPRMPPPGEAVLAAAQEYLRLLGPANDLEDQVFLGGWTIAQLRGNTARPGEANGGMKTVNPNTGGISPDDQVGYGAGVSIAAIQRDLSDPARVLQAVVKVPPSTAAGRSSAASPLQLRLADGSSLDLLAIVIAGEGEGCETTIIIDYPGYTMVPTGPRPWREDVNTGWFDGRPVAEASRNSGQAVSGFQFAAPPPYNLGPLAAGGDFGLITHLLICNPPIVTIHGSSAGVARLGRRLAPGAFARLGLLGPPPKGGPPAPLYSISYTPAADGCDTVVFTPVPTTLPPLQQTAYVMGGAFDFPGAAG